MGRDKPKDPENPVSTLRLTHGEQEAMKSIERSLQKQAFQVGFRSIYLAKKDAFRPANIAGMIGSVRQYSSAHLNGFKPGVKTDFDYKYQDISGNRLIAVSYTHLTLPTTPYV